ncbi:MAG: UDP-glucose:sterol glucosyltransferase, partial [uncultured Craurococcus sp.]
AHRDPDAWHPRRRPALHRPGARPCRPRPRCPARRACPVRGANHRTRPALRAPSRRIPGHDGHAGRQDRPRRRTGRPRPAEAHAAGTPDDAPAAERRARGRAGLRPGPDPAPSEVARCAASGRGPRLPLRAGLTGAGAHPDLGLPEPAAALRLARPAQPRESPAAASWGAGLLRGQHPRMAGGGTRTQRPPPPATILRHALRLQPACRPGSAGLGEGCPRQRLLVPGRSRLASTGGARRLPRRRRAAGLCRLRQHARTRSTAHDRHGHRGAGQERQARPARPRRRCAGGGGAAAACPSPRRGAARPAVPSRIGGDPSWRRRHDGGLAPRRQAMRDPALLRGSALLGQARRGAWRRPTLNQSEDAVAGPSCGRHRRDGGRAHAPARPASRRPHPRRGRGCGRDGLSREQGLAHRRRGWAGTTLRV